LVATNFLGQNTPAIAATEAQYMEMWFQDGLIMDTYALTSQQAVVLPQQTPAPNTSDGGTSANAAAAAQSTTSTGTNLATALQNLFPGLTGNSSSTSSNGLSSAASTLLSDAGVPSSSTNALSSAASTVAGSAAGDILPVQAVYYATMFASMPAKMLISMSNSMSASQAMQAGQQAMLADVTKLLDSKMKTMLAGISGQMRGFGSSITAQLASAGRLGGLSVPNGWAQAAPEMVRAAPILPANSIAAPNMSAAMPNSPFTQALMGSLNGRGMVTQAAKTASVKVETRTPAGG
jgi:PPE-repeat protein